MDAKEIYKRAQEMVKEADKLPKMPEDDPNWVRCRLILMRYGTILREIARLLDKGD